jgi:uncharacterized protein (TIGR03437 family)
MRTVASGKVIGLFFSLALSSGLAHNYGPAPRVTGAPGDNEKACTQCHTGTALNGGAGSVRIVLQSGPVYIPGVKQRVTVLVADPAQQRWGFELTARLNSDLQNGQAGQLIPVDNFTQVICEDASIQPCSPGVSFIQHTSAGTRRGTPNGAAFQFDWTPPATDAGQVTLFVAGNAANGDGTPNGDHIYTSNVQLTAVSPVAPSVTANNIVSAATSQSGPVSANSWITVYGSHLGVTTRGWQDSDFVNGGLPVSLDGVSVVLTANGAPRRAYVGYVSPTQVNFVLPSDIGPSTVQVQVKNPSGISAQVPLTVAANAPQMLTLDGEFVSATHADGTLVGKAGLLGSVTTAPAVPGETITLYGTGCGPTSPALTSGQVPTQAFSLATLPQITIGDAPANVVSATVLPGTGGVYQIKVQVPATAANGDLPVVAQLGTVSSASPLITVQR